MRSEATRRRTVCSRNNSGVGNAAQQHTRMAFTLCAVPAVGLVAVGWPVDGTVFAGNASVHVGSLLASV